MKISLRYTPAMTLVASVLITTACGDRSGTPEQPGATLARASTAQAVAGQADPMVTDRVDPASATMDSDDADDAIRSAPALSEAAETIRVNGAPLPFRTWHHLAMPGETVTFDADAPVRLEIDGETIDEAGERVEWTAPGEAGAHEVRLVDGTGEVRVLSLFVLEPLNGREIVEGYRIGEYPQNTPEGLIRLNEGDLDLPVSPSFTIGQFICKQQPGHWPKFVLVTGNMLRRLEAVLAELNADDLSDADSLFVMSGFRTPYYNTAIRSARLSRHMYGDAADIYPDVIGNDSVMDDLNGDGRITRADAEFLYDYAEDLFAAKNLPEGGIGAYDANAIHGPFVHIDGRGTRARWGRFGS